MLRSSYLSIRNLLAVAFVMPGLYGDTITLRTNKSFSGKFAGFDNGSIAITGSGFGKTGRLEKSVADISELEFNDVYDNVGAAPAAGARDDKSPRKNTASPKNAASQERTDTLFLDGGEKIKCAVTAIDKNRNVHCGAKVYDSVFKIRFGSR